MFHPDVKLVNYFSQPYKINIATARSCYSTDPISVSDIDDKWDWLVKSIFEAGHHTTLQNLSFQFILSNVSRQFVWSFLHNHPYYNSEQQSQRYVKMRRSNVIDIEGMPDHDKFMKVVDFQLKKYKHLSNLLLPLVTSEYAKRFPHRNLQKKKYSKDIEKKCQEIARYVLPICMSTHLYHTISGITLLRYYVCTRINPATNEFNFNFAECVSVVDKMVEEVCKYDSEFEKLIRMCDKEFPRRVVKTSYTYGSQYRDSFDRRLEGLSSKLLDFNSFMESTLVDAFDNIRQKLTEDHSTEDSIENILNPKNNKVLNSTLNVMSMDSMSKCMAHIFFVFMKKLSHTADSQNQRHRTSASTKPELFMGFDCYRPDFITPEIIKQDDNVLREYESIMDSIWSMIHDLNGNGYEKYLLPNAISIRMIESGRLLDYYHKYKMRLCYNAQEEIWRTSLEEVQQIVKKYPELGKWLLPPCGVRYQGDHKPICPEGVRFCGEKVWLYGIQNYQRTI